MSPFRPLARRNKSEEIAHQLLAQILGGEVVPGQMLPPERELAATFNTNRNTLREAIRNLETLNVVTARHGAGLQVNDYETEGEINLLPHYLRHARNHAIRFQAVRDMLRLRRLLLCEVSAFTAAKASEEDRQRLMDLMERQRQNQGDAEQLILTDLDMVMTMVRSGGSLAYQWIFNTLAQLFAEIALEWPTLWVYPADYIDSLARAVEAIVAGDGEGARVAMDSHLLKADEAIVEVLDQLEKSLED